MALFVKSDSFQDLFAFTIPKILFDRVFLLVVSNRWCVSTVCDVSSFSPQAALRRKELEQSLRWAQENDKTLRQIQESLANTDRHLTAYLADHIDAQQIPQEAQVAM